MSYETDYRTWLKYNCREALSFLGWALFVTMVAGSVAQWVAIVVVAVVDPNILEDNLVLWLLIAVPTYCVGIPAGCVMMKYQKVIAPPIPRKPLSPMEFAKFYVIALAALYIGNFITVGFTDLIGAIRGVPVSNPVETLDDFPMSLNILLTCVMAPVLEELLFRGVLLQRLRPYGDKFAILTSAICFGLFHGTISQVLYATAVGVVFAYVALRTGNLWQVMALHALVNAVSTVAIPLLEGWGETGEIILGVFVILVIVGGVLLAVGARHQWHFAHSELYFSATEKVTLFWLSGGGVFFTIVSVATMVLYLMME